MNAQFWVVQAFNGISYGALLFLIGSGLSLIFGVMRIVNLSHGAYFLWGGYIALSVIHFLTPIRPTHGPYRCRSPRSQSQPSASPWNGCSCAPKVWRFSVTACSP